MDEYQPISSEELKRGYFFLTHKDKIRKIVLALAILIIAVVYVVMIFNLIEFLGKSSFERAAVGLKYSPNWQSLHQGRQPQPIVASGAQALTIAPRRYNLLAFINNPNNEWAVKSFNYNFVVNGQALAKQTSFVNPGENRMILKMGLESTRPISELGIEVSDVVWFRLEDNIFEADFDITDVKYSPLTIEKINDEEFTFEPRLTWTAENLSLHDFWEVDFQIALFNGNKLVGVNELKVTDFDSLQKKDLEVIWLNDLSRVTRSEIYPVLNLADTNNIKPIHSEASGTDRVKL